jgi:VWFA-related protein
MHKLARILMRVKYSLLLFYPLTVWGAAPQEQPEVSSQQTPTTFSSRVNLVSVPVVVRDSKGRAVGNLQEDDFRLFDNGKQQLITRFSVQTNITHGDERTSTGVTSSKQIGETGGEASVESKAPTKTVAPDRYVAYVFDDLHLRWQDLAQMRAAAERHFAEALGPSNRAAIYTTTGRVSVDFTDDRRKLLQGLQGIGLSPDAFSGFPQQDGTDCPPDISYYAADMILNKEDKDALAAGVSEVVACYGPVPGADGIARGISETVLASNRASTQFSLGSLENAVRRMSVMPGSRTIILVSPGFMVPSELRPQEMDLMERAIRANIAISGLDARGILTYFMGDAARQRAIPNPESPRFRYKLAGAQADQDVMADLAAGTGGQFFHNDNGFEQGLDELSSPPEFTYVLGFSPQNLKLDGSFHNLKVSLVNRKGLDLQARRGYWAPNHAVDPAEQAREEIKDAVFSQEELQDIPLEVQNQFFRLSDTATSLTVSSRIDAKTLRFARSGDRNDDTLTVVTGLFNSDGTYVKGIQRVVDLRLRDQTLETVRDEGLTIEENFEVSPGRYFVRVVVRDSQGESMAARNASVEIQ